MPQRASLCVAADDDGGVLRTTTPAAAQPLWTRQEVDPTVMGGESPMTPAANAASVTCSSATQCVVVEANGNEFDSNDVGSAAPTWTTPQQIDPDAPLLGVACSTDTRCIAVDNVGGTIDESTPVTP
jgi:hypothetical protein